MFVAFDDDTDVGLIVQQYGALQSFQTLFLTFEPVSIDFHADLGGNVLEQLPLALQQLAHTALPLQPDIMARYK